MAINNFAAQIYYGSEESKNSDALQLPRVKFNYTLVIQTHNANPVNFHRVPTITLPNYTFENQQLNQYNRRRTVQTRLVYGPMTVTFYDTHDDAWQKMMNDYVSHYFNDRQGLNRRTEQTSSEDVTVENFRTELGYEPTNQQRFFFPEIKVVQNGYRGRYREIILKFPMITEIQSDQLSYAESQPVVYTATFQPESIQIDHVNSQFDDGI